MLIKDIIDFSDEMVAIRRDFHQHPELGFEEFRTSDRIAELLTGWGYEVHRGLAGTGVVGTLRHGTGTSRLGIRADMDALPIQEKTDLPWASQQSNKMHACGHDGHCAILLAAARYLAQTRAFNGTVHLIFQPSEEYNGGARRMVEEGLFTLFPCDAVYALHNAPFLPLGKVMMRSGAFLASTDIMTVTLYGKGGHGAMPQACFDPTVAAASIVMALQTIVARNVDPRQSAVLTVGSLQSGTAHNVIPETATLKLNIRTFDPQVRELIKARIQTLVTAQAQSFGLKADTQFDFGLPVTMNHAAETDFVLQVARETFGDRLVDDPEQVDQIMGSEDFACMLEACAGGYLMLGTARGENDPSVHHPLYDFNDEAIAVGATLWSRLVESYLK